MTQTPKRSTGETISQLIVIALLIAILIGAVILLRQFIDSHNSTAAPPATPSFSYSCCTRFTQRDLSPR
jgi:hypothetical protein